MYYFAYGSNMDKEHLDKWCKTKGLREVKFLDIFSAKLKDYELKFNYFSKKNWNAGAANIMESEKKCVYGLLINIPQDDLKTIRRKEGYYSKCYDEIYVSIEKFDRTEVENVKTYKAVKSREELDCQPPAREYIQSIIKIAEMYNFPDKYKNFLKKMKDKAKE